MGLYSKIFNKAGELVGQADLLVLGIVGQREAQKLHNVRMPPRELWGVRVAKGARRTRILELQRTRYWRPPVPVPEQRSC